MKKSQQFSCSYFLNYYGMLFFVVLVLGTSCASKKIIDSPTSFQGECLQGLSFEESRDEFEIEELKVEKPWMDGLDDKSIDMAIALNLVDELESYLNGELSDTKRLELKMKIITRVMRMDLEINALMSAIDCEEEKAEQLATFLDRSLRKRERNLTVAAIVIGATVGVSQGVSVAANDEVGDWLDYFGIAGGLAEVILGVSILRMDKKVSIDHPKNVLRDVYEGDSRPSYFPPSVWYYFNSERNNEENVSLKNQLIKRWEAYNLNYSGMSVMLDDGGEYASDLLKIRSEMLDQVESQIALINKDLLYFLNKIESL
ncbi:hypothetical protein ACFOUP_13855 [Belliella kenyensis]|uniref:Lipoprotein n=1 Tax=Belliella kenyensis TaxID=1472724 RepID=A0ABV8EQ29_9BACT|nr:hypothetical protein [Belliella kenyensis]MCH7401527.1 hypothetical protein [Belliella kenyensis]MDN3603193.1 hypothetical protein [Belliella kenyensis]